MRLRSPHSALAACNAGFLSQRVQVPNNQVRFEGGYIGVYKGLGLGFRVQVPNNWVLGLRVYLNDNYNTGFVQICDY